MQLMISTGDVLFNGIALSTSMTLNDLEGVFSDFFAIFGCRRVNCDKMDGHRPRKTANRNCYRLSCVS